MLFSSSLWLFHRTTKNLKFYLIITSQQVAVMFLTSSLIVFLFSGRKGNKELEKTIAKGYI